MLRRGLSLIEVLVVLAIIAVVVAFLLPNVRRVREAAARAKCANNLKQIALGLHMYADAFPQAGDRPGSAYPAGTLPHPTLPPEQRLSWLVSILPYIEQDAACKRFDLTAGADANDRTITLVPVYQCPGGSTGGTHNQYVSITGVGPDAAALPVGDTRAGVFGHDRRTRLADIIDGSSNTLLLLETGWQTGDWFRGGPATLRAIDPTDPQPFGVGKTFGGLHEERRGWLSRPDGGGNAALADGSVRYIRGSVSSAALAAWATVAGGETVTDLD